MDPKAFETLVKRAQEDPEFFHALVFDTESVLMKLDFLDRQTKAAIVAISPEQVIATIGGEIMKCGNTCTSSCGNTCGQSCGYTTNRTVDDLFDMFVNPAMLRGRIR